MPRDLSSIQAHADRARATATELYRANNMTVHMCDGEEIAGQHGMLDNIRDDLLALADALDARIEGEKR